MLLVENSGANFILRFWRCVRELLDDAKKKVWEHHGHAKNLVYCTINVCIDLLLSAISFALLWRVVYHLIPILSFFLPSYELRAWWDLTPLLQGLLMYLDMYPWASSTPCEAVSISDLTLILCLLHFLNALWLKSEPVGGSLRGRRSRVLDKAITTRLNQDAAYATAAVFFGCNHSWQQCGCKGSSCGAFWENQRVRNHCSCGQSTWD